MDASPTFSEYTYPAGCSPTSLEPLEWQVTYIIETSLVDHRVLRLPVLVVVHRFCRSQSVF
jgi:hypothetical protein